MKQNRRFDSLRIRGPLGYSTLLLCMLLLPIFVATAQQSTSVGGVTSCPEATVITKTIVTLLARSDLPKAQIKANIKVAVSTAVTAAPYAAAEIVKAAVSAANFIPQHSPPELAGGKLVKYLVKKGQEVSAGDPIALVEVNGQVVEFKASADGVIESTDIPVGQTIGADDQIFSIRHDDPELTAAVVSAAVAAAPSQALAITAAATTADPALAAVIQNAANSVTSAIQNPNAANQLSKDFTPENNQNPSSFQSNPVATSAPTPTPTPTPTPSPVSPRF